MGDSVGMVAVVIGGAQRQRAAPRHVNSALVPGDIQLSDALLTLTRTGWVCEQSPCRHLSTTARRPVTLTAEIFQLRRPCRFRRIS